MRATLITTHYEKTSHNTVGFWRVSLKDNADELMAQLLGPATLSALGSNLIDQRHALITRLTIKLSDRCRKRSVGCNNRWQKYLNRPTAQRGASLLQRLVRRQA